MTSFGALQELRRGSHAANPDLAELLAETAEEWQITTLIENLILSARLRWLNPKEQQRLAFLYHTYDWALEIYNNIYTINKKTNYIYRDSQAGHSLALETGQAGQKQDISVTLSAKARHFGTLCDKIKEDNENI